MRYLLLTLVFLSSFACKNPSPSDSPKVLSQEMGSYISHYTEQNLDIDESIMFRFAGTVITGDKIGQQADEVFSIAPRIKGKAFWKDGSTLMFVPEEHLAYDKSYKVRIQLVSLFPDIEEDKETVELIYKTSPLNVEVKLNKINYGANNKNLLSLEGRLTSNNVLTDEDVEEILSATQKGNGDLSILWDHTNKKRRNFTINNISRSKKDSELKVSWTVPGSKHQVRTMKILPIGKFKFLEAQLDKTDQKTIILSFSDQISKTQDLTGLVSIEDYKGKLTIDKLGSKLKVYADKQIPSPFTVQISQYVQRTDGDRLESDASSMLSISPMKPSLKLLGEGVIVPSSDKIIFPFVAKNLNSATVEIFKIFDNNVLQALHKDGLKNSRNMKTIGRIVHKEKISLSDYTDDKVSQTRRIALDIKNFVKTEPGAIYQVRVGFDPSDVSTYDCPETEDENFDLSSLEENQSIIDYRGYSNWSERDNPCNNAYYRPDKYISRNILASDLGIIAKVDKSNTCYVTVTNIMDVQAISGVTIEYYDFQQQLISSSKTNAKGQSQMKLERKPSFLILKHKGQYGYSNLKENQVNVLSEFDVSGKTKKKGLDGYIYGERGVWRPGDTLFLNFVLEDINQTLPTDHPIKIEVKDSKSKIKLSKTTRSHVGRIYHIAVPTSSSDPTGNWRATVVVGNQKFTKTLKVETVKPNRLKIALEVPNDKISLYNKQKIKLESAWLHGASADGLKAKIDLQLSSMKTNFLGYSEYSFDDPARKVSATPVTVFDGKLNENGTQTIELKKQNNWAPPGKLKANLKTRVFEKSGNFSEDNFTIETDIYSSYVGVKIPKTRWGSNFISNDGEDKIKIQTLDTEGKPLSYRKLAVGIYEARWSWWYDRGYSQKYNYNSAQHNGAILKEKISTNNKGIIEYQPKLEEEYGNYMIRICDEESGHCTGGFFYTGNNWYRQTEKQGPQLLNFTADKSDYLLGETIKVKVPSNADSKIFVSIENGDKVLDSYWVTSTGELTEINIPTTSEMNPNIYVHAALIQKHSSKENDFPIRMYGVIALKVVDPNTTLLPVVDAPEKARPDEHYEIKVSESSGQTMYYTLAVVDEGLLGLTRHKVPDIWGHFFAKQAIGVKTWDIYDLVLTGYGNDLGKLISIGGDGVNKNANKQAKANRFRPTVKHLGPFKLEAGATARHKIKITDYVGAVRTMVVARQGQKYGSAEKTTQIKKPLMVQATLPRVLGPGESLEIPANIFAMEDNIKDVNVSFQPDGNLSLIGDAAHKLSFSKPGDKLTSFEVKVGDAIGVTKMNISAQSGKESSEDKVELEIRNPNPVTTKVQRKTLQPGESWTTSYTTLGTTGTNEGVLELSNVLPINLDQRIKYLIRYPYGCIEQTTSSAFPQLYLDDLVELSPKQRKSIEKNIQKTIERLSLFQLSNGGLSYWAGNNDVSNWGSIYAFHFLLEAKEKGYFVPKAMIDNLGIYLSNESDKTNRYSSSYHDPVIEQAYRVYVLAKAGQANVGAMNRIRNNKNLSATSAYLLAAAYAQIHKKELAMELIRNKKTQVKPYRETGYNYGSHLRDQGLILETMTYLGLHEEMTTLAESISNDLDSDRWYSTHTTAVALLSVGKYISKLPKDNLLADWSAGGVAQPKIESDKAYVSKTIEVEKNQKSVTLTNNSKGILYAKLLVSGQAPPGKEGKEAAQHLNMTVSYKDLNGKTINPTSLKQGTDFKVEVKIENIGTKGRHLEELVLNQIFPSGWEIQNQRLSGRDNSGAESNYEYRDIRDDRVNTFFDIDNETLSYTTFLTATYSGKFYLPPTHVEAMYDNEIQAQSTGQWIEVR